MVGPSLNETRFRNYYTLTSFFFLFLLNPRFKIVLGLLYPLDEISVGGGLSVCFSVT